MTDAVAFLPTLIGVATLAAITTTVLVWARIPHPLDSAIAIARGVVQLALISVILTGVISSPAWIGVALIVMFTIAVVVATRRTGWDTHTLVVNGTAMAAGLAITVIVVFASGALELSPRYALAIGAILIGNTMSVATLTGRVFMRAVHERWDEVEGWLALGATPRLSTREIGRQSVREALIPSIDQTKTTGLVVLPGAFVGAIFGGVSPVEAGRFQIVVLAAILCAGAVTSLLMWRWLGDVRTKPPMPA